MLLRQLYDWRCNPDFVQQIKNRIFLQLSEGSIEIWCNIQKIFKFVTQKYLQYNCYRKLYCQNDTTYNWLKTTLKVSNNI